MSSISVDYDVLNQKGSPAWYSDLFANIPTPGYKGRMFISTDTFAFYRDNGVGWDLVGGPGTGTITGAGVFGQVTFFSGTDTISGNTDFVWDNTNKRLGINTGTPGAPLDIHTTGTAAQFNGTTTNNAFVLFQNAGTSKWRIGNLYNSGANDYQIFDVTNSTARLTIKNTGASTLIGTFTATSLIKSGGTSSQILLADGSTTPTSTFGAGSVTNVSALTLGTTGVDLSSSVANSTTTPTITLNVPTASATNRGALSSADWTTFNNKQATITLTTTGTSGAATLVGATLNIPNYTNVGTVTSVAALTLGTSGTDLSSSVANSTSTPVITLNVPTASATNRGALSSADWTTFNSKQATISVTAPVVLTGATISMPAATTSVNGYLTSTDWNTFNNKTSNLGTVTDVVALTIGTSGIDITSTAVTTTTTPVITLNIPTASASNRGALSSTDWTTFNNKQATLSLTTTGTSGVATLVANVLNVPNYGSGAVTGSGTTNTLPKFTAASTIGDSIIKESSSLIGIGGTPTGTYGKLSVFGGISIINDNNAKLQIGRYSSGTPNSYIVLGPSSSNLIFTSSGDLVDLMTLTNGGNLGIGVTPSAFGSAAKVLQIGARMTVYNDGSNNALFGNNTYFDGGSNLYINTAVASRFYLESSSAFLWQQAVSGTAGNPITFTTAMTLNASGNLGIGTASPQAKLQVSGSTNFSAILKVSDTATEGTGTIVLGDGNSSSMYVGIWRGQANSIVTNGNSLNLGSYSDMVFTTGAAVLGSQTERMRLTSNGVLFVNATTSTYGAASGYNLGVKGTSGQTYISIARVGQSLDSQGMILGLDTSAGQLTMIDNLPLLFNTNNTLRLTIASSGAATFTSTIDLTGDITTTASSSTANAIISGLQFKNSANSGNVKAKIVSKNGSDSDSMGLSFQTSTNTTNISEKLLITGAGIVNATSRANFLGATDNALFSLNSGGTLYTVGFSPTATASSTNTFTLTTGTTTWIYTGTGTATWTLPNPSGNNQIYWIKNAGTGIITLNAYSGTNIINNAAASVSSITIAVGSTAVIAQDGNVKSYQLQ